MRTKTFPLQAATSLNSLEEPRYAGVGHEPDDDRRAARRLQLFMGARLAVATLLLGGTLAIVLEGDRGFDSFTPQFLVALIAAIYAGSLASGIWLLGCEHRDRVAISQLVGDLLVTTGLIYVTGGTHSGFIFLYGVAVLMAAMVVGPLAARLTGAGSIILYGSMIAGLWTGLIPHPPDQSPEAYRIPAGELAYTALLHLSGLFLVTVLAGNLSARVMTAGGQLRRAEANAATLAQLNEDIVRSLSSGLLTTGPHGEIRSINAIGLEIFGAEAIAIIGKPVNTLLPVSREAILGTLEDSGPSISRAEGEAARPDGTHFAVGYSVNRLISVDGSAIGALVVFQDLTEISDLRAKAARQERLAVLGRLSAGLAHEIRNPLSSISGSVELVRESSDLNTEDRRLLGIVLDEVERLDELVSTMLQVGRPRQPRRAETDLRGIVEDVVKMARQGPCRTAHIDIQQAVPDTPVFAVVDRDQIRQVVWNLVKNAVQASPPQTVVRVAARITDAGQPQLEVTDEGQGLDAAQQSRVYDMFHSERTHGAGIGLALVRQIVDAHGATIGIDSDAGHGAAFVVTFHSQPQLAASG